MISVLWIVTLSVQGNRQATFVSGIFFAHIGRTAEGYSANCKCLYCKRHHEILKCHTDTKCKILSFSVHLVTSGLR